MSDIFFFILFCQVWANQDLLREQTKELATVRYYSLCLKLLGVEPDFSISLLRIVFHS